MPKKWPRPAPAVWFNQPHTAQLGRTVSPLPDAAQDAGHSSVSELPPLSARRTGVCEASGPRQRTETNRSTRREHGRRADAAFAAQSATDGRRALACTRQSQAEIAAGFAELGRRGEKRPG